MPFFDFHIHPSLKELLAPASVLTGDELEAIDPVSAEIHYNYFLNQLFHFLKIAQQARIPLEKAITQVCIGSDFDGLINPIDCCTTATAVPNFKEGVRRRLKNGRKNWDRVGIGKKAVDIDKLVEGLFYVNGVQFLHRFFV